MRVEELRELIAVPPHIERMLRAYAKAQLEDAPWIEACLKFRQALAEEFERFLCDNSRCVVVADLQIGHGENYAYFIIVKAIQLRQQSEHRHGAAGAEVHPSVRNHRRDEMPTDG